MKVIVKTIKGEKVDIQVEPTATVLDVKTQLENILGFEIEAQKLVFKGKHTKNEDKIESLAVKEGDFFVVMCSKKKQEQNKEGEKQKIENVPQGNGKASQGKKDQKTSKSAPSAEQQSKIEQIVNMGFDREHAIMALNAASNNVDIAIQYCLSGFNNFPGAQGDYGFEEDDDIEMEIEDSEQMNELDALISSPIFQRVKQALSSNDSSQYDAIINEIKQSQPELYALITQHPQMFLQLIQKAKAQDLMQEQEGEGEVIPITNQQNQAIQRLMALGFEKIQAAQAYMACDKNEQMAANLLFQRQANGDFQQNGGNEDDDNDNLFS